MQPPLYFSLQYPSVLNGTSHQGRWLFVYPNTMVRLFQHYFYAYLHYCMFLLICCYSFKYASLFILCHF